MKAQPNQDANLALLTCNPDDLHKSSCFIKQSTMWYAYENLPIRLSIQLICLQQAHPKRSSRHTIPMLYVTPPIKGAVAGLVLDQHVLLREFVAGAFPYAYEF